MADEALENALDRFYLDKLAAHGTMADVLLALKEHKEWVREARRQLAEAKSACFYAFASGAKWWEFHSTKGTMWQSDQHEVEEAAAERYPYVPHLQLAEAKAAREQAEAACAAMRQWIDGLQASAPDSLAQYLLAGHPDPPQDGQALLDERDRLRAIADALLRKTSDGVYYAAYDPQESNPPLWAVWRYEELEPWRVSRAHTPTTPDEVSTDFDLLIEDAEDQCVVFGIYSTPEAAEAAKETT